MVRVGLALALTAACRLAYAQQAADEETPGAHKKVVPPPPPAPAAQPAPKAPEPAAQPEPKGKKPKKGKKKKGEEIAPAPTPAPTPPPVAPAAPPPAVTPATTVAPQAVEVEPAVPPPRPVAAEVVRDVNAPAWSLGFHLRYITVPGFLEFTQVNHPLHSAAFGFEGIRRKGELDIVFGLDFAFMSPEDGNWLGNNKNPASDTDFLQFKNLNVIALEVTWIWHHALNEWAQLEWGVGGGLGIVTGKLLRISDGTALCASTPGDVQACHPIVCAQGPCTEAELAAHQAPAGVHDDSAGAPQQFQDDNVPPVVPILQVLFGATFKVSEKMRVRVEGGFHDAFFIGAGTEYAL